MKEKNLLRMKILELLPDGENNLNKFQQVIDGASQRLVSLANQWEKHRIPLIEKYRKSVQVQSDKTVSVLRGRSSSSSSSNVFPFFDGSFINFNKYIYFI